MKIQLFKRQPAVEESIDNFLDTMSETGILFHEDIKAYIVKNSAEFIEKTQRIIKNEHEADMLRRDIETQIYRKNLIPESSGDVLALLEKLDNIINQIGYAMTLLDIEKPVIPDHLQRQYESLGYIGMNCVETLVLSARSFFKNLPLTHDHLHKVTFWESEGDKAILNLQRIIFDSDLDFAAKWHLKSIANAINNVSDMSEDAADMLQIFVIKHSF